MTRESFIIDLDDNYHHKQYSRIRSQSCYL